MQLFLHCRQWQFKQGNNPVSLYSHLSSQRPAHPHLRAFPTAGRQTRQPPKPPSPPWGEKTEAQNSPRDTKLVLLAPLGRSDAEHQQGSLLPDSHVHGASSEHGSPKNLRQQHIPLSTRIHLPCVSPVTYTASCASSETLHKLHPAREVAKTSPDVWFVR